MKTVLVIEDDGKYQLILSGLIGGRFALSFASDLRTGLSCLGRCSPDAILLDLELPDSGRADTLRQVKAVRGTAAIVVVSGHDDPAFVSKTIGETADGFIRKLKDDQDADEITHQLLCAIATRAKCLERDGMAKRFEVGL